MKLKVLALLACLSPFQINAQNFNPEEFNAKRYQINRNGMAVLGGWGLANLAYSGVAVFNAEGENKAFHQMNIGWGAINMALAGFGYFGTRNAQTDLSTYESIKQLETSKRIFLFNAGLDLAYIAGGAYLNELSKNTSDPERANQAAGFGKSVMIQGGFLFGFDLVMYFVLQNHGNQNLYNLISGVQLSPNGFRVAVNLD